MTITPPPGESLPQPRPSLRERKKDATRRAIEEAAWELFVERGYDATSVNDIAERAMIAPRTFFRYYPTKEAVLYPQFDELIDNVREIFSSRPRDEPVIASLLVALERIAASVTPDVASPERVRVLKEIDPEVTGEYFRLRIADTVRQLVMERDAGAPDVALRADLAAGVLQLVMDTVRDHWRATGSNQSMAGVGPRCIALLGEMIGMRPADP